MKRRPTSLVVRLTVSIGIVITVVLLVFGWMIERSITEHFVQQDVDELNAVVYALQHTVATLPPNIAPEELEQRLTDAISGHHSAHYYISDAADQRIYQSPGSDLERFSRLAAPIDKVSVDTVGTWKKHGETLRGAVVWLESNGLGNADILKLTVATNIDFHLYYLDDFRNYLRLVTMAACLIAILAIWFAVYQGHAPIRNISREIRRIGSDQLHTRLDPNTVPRELVELAVSFNEMLGRLEDVFQRLSDFSGDIAHELRTPITNLKTQTEVALSHARSVEQYQEVLYSNLEEYERIAHIIGDMLFLAQADNKLLKPELVTINLEAEMRILFDYFSAWAEEKNVLLELKGEQLWMVGDRLMMRRALSNLLSNAIRYTPVGSRVIATLSINGTSASIGILNAGEPIPAEHLPHIFDRFYRPDASRQRSSEGAGLGLAITRSIIEAHGGSISVQSDREGTIFNVLVPAMGGCGSNNSEYSS
ncbi:MAG TPA: Cu(+)/Ag(+) sensor histidine kinase [Paenalcaligenes sp.]|nr:Cu(+)/Ag(+) sensor histidine kinase [Paenalcaligenes sp.]